VSYSKRLDLAIDVAEVLELSLPTAVAVAVHLVNGRWPWGTAFPADLASIAEELAECDLLTPTGDLDTAQIEACFGKEGAGE